MNKKFIMNKGLFNNYTLQVFSENEKHLYITKKDINAASQHLSELIKYWRVASKTFLAFQKGGTKKLEGVPENYSLADTTESDIEQGLIRKTLELMGYEHKISNNKSIKSSANDERPDMILFATIQDLEHSTKDFDKKNKFNGVEFCKPATCLLEAKKTKESLDSTSHIEQIQGYLENYAKDWGILSNGLSWRLTHRASLGKYLQFNLVEFLHPFIENPSLKPSNDDVQAFAFFEHLFGLKAFSTDFLTNLYNETQKANANLQEILKKNAHKAVEEIASGFWSYENNRSKNWINAKPNQEELDDLREKSLVLLYRLLFILNAEGRNLLRKEHNGKKTAYAHEFALSKLLHDLESRTPEQLQLSSVYQTLLRLFDAIDTGDTSYDVPAYNGGLFDRSAHPDLAKWGMTDLSLKLVLTALMYEDQNDKREIVWESLDVRDLGDVYEGLLEQRLVLSHDIHHTYLALKNEKGERKASGSYFTPDSMVEQLVNATLMPLLDKCNKDPNKILNLKILDPAMGSGHFLVKVVDVMGRYLAVHCDPQDLDNPDKGVKDTNDDAERKYWRRKVVEHCIYGVDFNPMSVELAKVSLWLHTAEFNKPLSFLSHHLKVGNSLLGANINSLKEPALYIKELKSGKKWESKERIRNKSKVTHSNQLALQTTFLDQTVIKDLIKNIHSILENSSSSRKDIEHKREQYKQIVNKLSAHRLLADLWCSQWFFVDPDEQGEKAFGEHGNSIYNQLLKICDIQDEKKQEKAIAKFQNNSFIQMIRKNSEHGYGPRPTMFFHWQLEYPEVAFDEHGNAKHDYGFDAVLGNPPWDKIKPETKSFYAPYSEEITNTQGSSAKKLIHDLELQYPHLPQEWQTYKRNIKQTVFFLKESTNYKHQSAIINGKKTGGDPDLFRFFVERAYQCVRPGGRVGLVTPAALWQSEGCTALRQLLFTKNQVEQLYTFENFRKWAFQIHTSFKFSSFVFQKLERDEPCSESHTFDSAFMLRHDDVLKEKGATRFMKLSVSDIKNLSPDTLALLDFKSRGDSSLASKLHKSFPALGKSDWHIKYRRELDMTNDAYLFRKPDWMKNRGFNGLTSNNEVYYENRGYEARTLTLKDDIELPVFIHPDDIKEAQSNPHLNESHFYIVPSETYVPLYEGRMVHIFDHCQKEYHSGEGRKAKWGELPFSHKTINPRVYVSMLQAQLTEQYKLGFCDVTGATNERSTLSCLLPTASACGHKVPTFTTQNGNVLDLILLQCLMSSFVWDYLIRLRVSTSMTMNFLNQVPVPSLSDINDNMRQELCERAVKLSCTTPEMASYWDAIFPNDPWTEQSATRDLKERATLRAEIDARIAYLYDLSLEEYARILTHFPLMDRKYAPLKGDAFIAEGTEEIKHDRAFITRDFALHHYLLYLREQGEKINFIDNLETFYKDKVKLDPNSEESRFRIGTIKDLEERIQAAFEENVLPYVPGSPTKGN